MKIRITNLRTLPRGGHAWTVTTSGNDWMASETLDRCTNSDDEGLFAHADGCRGSQLIGTCDFSLRRKSPAAVRAFLARHFASEYQM